jgi:hypothetical protein
MAAVRATRSPVSLATSQTDRRSALAGAAEEAALRDEVKAALTGEAWAGTDAQIRDIASELSRLRRSTSTAQAAMLESGRRLLRLQELAGEGGYRALHRAGLIPMNESAASKLRTIAAAVDGGHIPAAALPRAVEAAVIVARLNPPEAARLIEAGVVRPEVTVQQIRDAVRPRKAASTETPLTPSERRLLERRAQRLRAELARVEARLGRP